MKTQEYVQGLHKLHWKEVSSQFHVPAASPQERSPRNLWTVGWVGPRGGLNAVD
jgi:hypothetical protein